MSNLDINSPLDSNDVGVDRNRLIITSRPTGFGTFAVTTPAWTDNDMASDKIYGIVPFEKASSFRINNYTGKIIGIRRRHKEVLVDNFENPLNPSWTGSVKNEHADIEGFYSGGFTTQAYRPLTTEKMLEGSEVEVKIKTPNLDAYTSVIAIWDSPSRIGAGDHSAKFEATESNTIKNTTYKVIFRLNTESKKYDVFLELGGIREQITSGATGEFGTNEMKDSVVSVESSNYLIVDTLVYLQKVNYSHEQMPSPSSMVYPCVDNISEYEVVNLGSDALNYSDTNINVTLSGFYAV